MVAEVSMEGRVEINNPSLWYLLQKKASEARILKAFNLFRENGIEPVLIKGYAAGLFYPDTKPREFIDMDLAVASDAYDLANEFALSAAAKGLAIDLHRELRHLDTVAWDDLFSNSRLIAIDGGTIRVLRPEDHLRVLCVHWLNDGGVEKERLWDMYYMIENRPDDFDWDRLLNSVDVHRRRWLTCAIGLAHVYLGLDLAGTPIEAEAEDLPKWLIKTVEKEWATGVPHLPLHIVMRDRKKLMAQIGKRLRPNPIWATIDMEGNFDARTRVFYQIGSNLKRTVPSFRRISDSLSRR